ncbi:uncharacterized protein Dwil_GK22190 [Drosophila willistoni]|uniref:MADF domain-containing protein n=1 Tax=Drosophila willistoni TaxID=7260 RepID=B4MYB5_DROWI|nr:uncharacterized protein Dwil_GK22190 [Drosophila willistoni]
MMDEQLIDEVAHHGVIYNRQKYYLNGSALGGKYETKEEAWTIIAMKLRTDVETCKKRWKYLRERYVSQRKQGDPPVYEHLSRPYLEKMKFLDQHIQPRKSYRNVPNFLTSPQSANSSNYSEYNVDSKSNSSVKNMSHFGQGQGQGQGSGNGAGHHYHQPDAMNVLSTAAASALETVNGQVKIEAEIFRDFAAAVASHSQQLQQISQSQMQQQQAAAVAAVMADSSQGYQEQYRDNSVVGGVTGPQTSAGSLTSTSSSMKSPLSSPLAVGIGSQQQQQQQTQSSPASGQQATTSSVVHSSSSVNSNMQPNYNHKNNDDLDSSTGSNYHMKRPRVQMANGNNNHAPSQMSSNNGGGDFQDSDGDSDSDLMEPQTMLQQHDYQNNNNNSNNNSNNNNNNSLNMQRSGNNIQQQQQQQQHQNMFPSNTDFLFQLYQQLPQQQQQHQQGPGSSHHVQNFGKFPAPPNPQPSVQRSSEHLLGELVTTELLKMNKDRRKNVQKRILEILFFDD